MSDNFLGSALDSSPNLNLLKWYPVPPVVMVESGLQGKPLPRTVEDGNAYGKQDWTVKLSPERCNNTLLLNIYEVILS